MKLYPVVFVDDETSILAAVKRLMSESPLEVYYFDDPRAALGWLEIHPAGLVVSDYRMEGLLGTAFLAAVAHRYPLSRRVLFSGQTDFPALIEAVNLGAISRFITKPWVNQDFYRIICTESFLVHLSQMQRRLPQWMRDLIQETSQEGIQERTDQICDELGFHLDLTGDLKPGSDLVELAPGDELVQQSHDMAQTVTQFASLAKENWDKAEKLKGLSETDALSGLKNRGYFEKCLNLEWERAQRFSQPLALILMDIDWFKTINDSHGHEAGDLVIRTLGQVVRAAVRSLDIACRYGGDEFVILLPGVGAPGAEALAERLRIKIQKEGFAFPVSLSIGIAEKSPTFTDARQILNLADRGLYMAKKQGRDRAVLAVIEEPLEGP